MLVEVEVVVSMVTKAVVVGLVPHLAVAVDMVEEVV